MKTCYIEEKSSEDSPIISVGSPKIDKNYKSNGILWIVKKLLLCFRIYYIQKMFYKSNYMELSCWKSLLQ